MKRDNWRVEITLNDWDETVETQYVPIPKGVMISPIKRNEIILEYLNRTYGNKKWLAFNVEEP